MKKSKKKGDFTTVLLFIVFLTGLSLLLYPTVADLWNARTQSRAISDYSSKVKEISKEDYTAFLQAAEEYNRALPYRTSMYTPSEEEKAQYKSLLNLTGNGVMGYIEIPAIDVSLPVNHGTSDSVLQTSVGHLEWTSLPVGGLSSHCVLSGHRGLPSAKLFTNLDKLVVGDVFILRILDEVFTYQVDQILIVEPENTAPLQIEQGLDLCTLVTCTPYGINTHRLLVRGRRTANAEQAVLLNITAEAAQIDQLIVSAVLAVPALLVMLVVFLSTGGRKKETQRKASAQALTLQELKLREQKLREMSVRDDLDRYQDR